MRTIIPEEEVKQFIILFVNRHDRFPTTREIRDHFGSGGLNRYSEIPKCRSLKSEFHPRVFTSNVMWNESEVTYR